MKSIYFKSIPDPRKYFYIPINLPANTQITSTFNGYLKPRQIQKSST